MEGVTKAVNSLSINNSRKKYRIQVSNTKKPLFFYVNLAKVRRLNHQQLVLDSASIDLLVLLPVSREVNLALYGDVGVVSILLRVPVFVEKRHMQLHNEVELSALGMGKGSISLCFALKVIYAFVLLLLAIATTVSIAEILKNSGFATVKQIMTSTVDIKDDSRVRPLQKAKIAILLGKTEEFDELMAAAAEVRDGAQGAEQN
ncbi:hypothetical protein IEQ34_020130 [Dendrobium chrysotoxum]|uniref:Uncharacterized protein n=1 Tax=Dendrobium chrysotoxum TaxID=161865 RepID=A0AAV7G197_DENCH|nr:hypothetical protein IEQ34_020130 [Dendrobium chrysotoxum]